LKGVLGVLLNSDLVVASYYCPPNSPIDAALLNHISNLHTNVIILGDLNAKHQSWGAKTNEKGQKVIDFLDSSGFTIVNDTSQPTFAIPARRYSSVLDLAITSPPVTQIQSNFKIIKDFFLTDHYTLLFQIDSTIRNRHGTRTVTTINWEKFDSIAHSILTEIPPCHTINSTAELDNFVDLLTTSVQRIVTESSSTVTISNCPKFIKLPRSIVNLIRLRSKLRRALKKRTATAEERNIFNRLTNDIHKAVAEHKENQWQDFCTSLNEYTPSDGKLWRKLASINSKNERKPPSTPCIRNPINNQLTSDPVEVANIFAEHLEDVFTPHDDPSFDAGFKERVDKCPRNPFAGQDIVINATSPVEVASILKGIRGTGAPGPDGITNRVLKRMPPIYAAILSPLINASMQLGHLPDCWKVATIVMIPKPGKDHELVNGYRPISLLNVTSKIAERVVKKRIEEWISSKSINSNINLLSKFQCGFRTKRQTKDQIFRLVQAGLEALNADKTLCAIFIDIAMAFDRVWHEGFIWLLKRHDIPAYLGAWLVNYLSKRNFSVRIGTALSLLKTILAGVPQGSVLGPLIFIIFFNGIVKRLNATQVALYADDIAAWCASSDFKEITKTLQDFLNDIQEWLSQWRVRLNIDKTNYFTITRAIKHNKINLTFDGTLIAYNEKPKFLGVTLDRALTFKYYVAELVIRCDKRLNMLRSIRGRDWGASQKLLLITYKALIRSLLDYASIVQLALNPTRIVKLDRIQREAARIITRSSIDTNIIDLYQQLNLDTVHERAQKMALKYWTQSMTDSELIIELKQAYDVNPVYREGAECGAKPRTTIIGAILDLP